MRWLLALLLALCALPAQTQVWPYPGPGRSAYGAPSGDLCPGSFQFCLDFEDDSTGTAPTTTCDENPNGASPPGIPTLDTGNRDCDCTTTNCLANPDPTAIPNGTQAMVSVNEANTANDTTSWENAIDDADVSDELYFKACFSILETDADAADFRTLVRFRTDAASWTDGASTGDLKIFPKAAPQLQLNCPSGPDSFAVNISANTLYTVTVKAGETTSDMELCINANTIGSTGGGTACDNPGVVPCCAVCNGTGAPAKIDGLQFWSDNGSVLDEPDYMWDAVRVQGTPFSGVDSDGVDCTP